MTTDPKHALEVVAFVCASERCCAMTTPQHLAEFPGGSHPVNIPLVRLADANAAIEAARREAHDALEAARVWWLGKTEDGTLPHSDGCNLMGDAVEAARGCDCPSPAIHAALDALKERG